MKCAPSKAAPIRQNPNRGVLEVRQPALAWDSAVLKGSLSIGCGLTIAKATNYIFDKQVSGRFYGTRGRVVPRWRAGGSWTLGCQEDRRRFGLSGWVFAGLGWCGGVGLVPFSWPDPRGEAEAVVVCRLAGLRTGWFFLPSCFRW